MFDFGNLVTVGLVFSAFSFGVSVLLITAQNLLGQGQDYFRILAYLKVNSLSALGAWLITGQSGETLALLALGLANRDDAMTKLVAEKVMAAASTGERDPHKIKQAVLDSLK